MGARIKGWPAAAVAGAVLVSLAGVAPAQAAAAWRIAARPPLKPASRLLDVSATGPADAWAVGYQDNAYGRIPVQPEALVHWDGSTWSERALPGEFDIPAAVSAVTPQDVWAVGRGADLSAYAAHWDGTAWQGQPVPEASGGLSDVAARYGRPLVVGSQRTGNPLVLEGDGRQFTEVTVPGSHAWTGTLSAVTTTAGGAAFAVGSWHVDDAAYPEPLIVQRLAGSWRVATLPKVPEARLTGVHARSATDAWAVGTIGYDSSRPQPLILHWDGVSWQRVAAPVASAGLWAISGDAAGNLWVSGNNPTEPYGVAYPGSLFLRYQVKKWSVVYGPKVNASDPFLSAVENIPGTQAFWGVGTVHDPGLDHVALVERIG
jgi:hypothetical protein